MDLIILNVRAVFFGLTDVTVLREGRKPLSTRSASESLPDSKRRTPGTDPMRMR